jgi:arylsulfatase A-like enzyme
MTVAPFAGYDQGKAFRGVRTARYTYVRDVEGPWLLYDNESDPYQMKNLVNLPEHAALQQSLEAQLQARLRAVGDPFKAKSHYLTEWGYEVDRRGCIPYHRNAPVQGPGFRRPL